MRIWSVDRREVEFELEADNPWRPAQMASLAFSPDGRILAVSRIAEPITLHDASTARRLAAMSESCGSSVSLAFSPDGRALAAGTISGGVELFDVSSGRRYPTPRRHSGAVRSLAFCADGRFLVSGGLDGTLRLWAVR